MTSYTSFEPSERLVYPEITSEGTPSSSSRVNEMTPCEEVRISVKRDGQMYILLIEVFLDQSVSKGP